VSLANLNRYNECGARLEGFCEVIGPILQQKAVSFTQTEGD